jgi:hypothetical protein
VKIQVYVFLRKHGFDQATIDNLNIPKLPFHTNIWAQLLDSPLHLPLSILKDRVAYQIFNIRPPATIVSFIEKLRMNPLLRDTPEVQIFLSRYGAGIKVVRESNVQVVNLLLKPDQLQGSITPNNVQEQFLKLYSNVLFHDTSQLIHLQYITRPLWNFYHSSGVEKSWGNHHKPIVEAIIAYVEGIRTKEWQKDPHRCPQFLPDTFEFHMWLLQYAAQFSPEANAGNHEAHCEKFASRVAKISDSMAGTFYHKKFQMLKQAMECVPVNYRKRVALYLGDISKTILSWLTMRDLLRVELAACLFTSQWGEHLKDEDLDKKVDAMSESWRQSENEEVRRLGFTIRQSDSFISSKRVGQVSSRSSSTESESLDSVE